MSLDLLNIRVENPLLVTNERVVITDPVGVYHLGKDGVRAFICDDTATDFIVRATPGGVPLTPGIDYSLVTDVMDTEYTGIYGHNIYSGFKSIRLSTEAYVTYKPIGSYDDAGILIAISDRLTVAEDKLVTHQTHLTAIDTLNATQDGRLSESETEIEAHDTRITTAESNIETLLNPDVMRMTNRTAAPATTTGRLSLYAEADALKAKTSSGSIKRFADIADGAAMTAGLPAVFQGDGSIAAGAWEGGSGGVGASAIALNPMTCVGTQNIASIGDQIIVGGYLYVVSGTYILKLHSSDMVQVGAVNIGTSPQGLSSDGTYIFVCVGTWLWRILISDFATTQGIDFGIGVAYTRTACNSTHVFVGGRSGAPVRRLTPLFGDNTPLSIPSCFAMALTPDYLYAAYGTAGGYIYRVLLSDLSYITIYPLPVLSASATIQAMCADDDYVYGVADDGTLIRIKISDNSLTSLTDIGTPPLSELYECKSISVVGAYAYVLTNNSSGRGEIHRIQIHDQSGAPTLTKIDSLPLGTYSSVSMVLDGLMAFAALSTSTLRKFDLSFSPVDAAEIGSDILSINMAGGNVDISSLVIKHRTIRLYGALTANNTLIMSTRICERRIINECTGAYYTHLKTASGTGVYSYGNDVLEILCDGTNVSLIRANENLIVGVERLTGEYWVGYPEYAKTISFGGLPSATAKPVAHGITGNFYPRSVNAIADNGTNFYHIPFAAGPDLTGLYLTRSSIVISTSMDKSTYTKCYVTIKYIKVEL